MTLIDLYQTTLDNVHLFLSKGGDVHTFVDRIYTLWIYLRDTFPEDAITINHISRDDSDTIEQDKVRQFRQFLDELHSLCVIHNDVPESPWEITTQQLRQAVASALATYPLWDKHEL